MTGCEDCARRKQKSLNKVKDEKFSVRGERLYMDGSSIQMKIFKKQKMKIFKTQKQANFNQKEEPQEV